jgi:hypothetical protein
MRRFPPYPFIATFICLVACGCVTRDQKQFIQTAREITEFPVKREHLISVLNLDRHSSWRNSDIICYGLNFRETWRHESGLTITATDSEPAGIDYGFEFDKMISPMQGNLKIVPKRSSFDFFVVANDRRVLYRSWDGEQEAGTGQSAARPKSKSERSHKPQPESEGHSR